MFAAIAPNAATTAIVTYDLLSIVSISFDIYVITIKEYTIRIDNKSCKPIHIQVSLYFDIRYKV
jgi:hypothetical protein